MSSLAPCAPCAEPLSISGFFSRPARHHQQQYAMLLCAHWLTCTVNHGPHNVAILSRYYVLKGNMLYTRTQCTVYRICYQQVISSNCCYRSMHSTILYMQTFLCWWQQCSSTTDNAYYSVIPFRLHSTPYHQWQCHTIYTVCTSYYGHLLRSYVDMLTNHHHVSYGTHPYCFGFQIPWLLLPLIHRKYKCNLHNLFAVLSTACCII